MDAVQRANSGHPGMPMGFAPAAFALWTRHLRHSPRNPDWFDRDRFILSAGHGSMLIYSLLHLTGYELSLEDIKGFRTLDSQTPGHPENFVTPGVEVTTGPLGQGFGMAVGMAIAERILAATFPNAPLDHTTYVVASDGDLMEGLSAEAASLAGHLLLGKLIVLYDDNRITIDGATDLCFTEDVEKRFRSLGWHVISLEDGMDVDAVDRAIAEAKSDSRPSLIRCRTVIGYGSPNKAGDSASHGAALGEDEVRLAKLSLGMDPDESFSVPQEAYDLFCKAIESGKKLERDWNAKFDAYRKEHPQEAREFEDAIRGEWGNAWLDALPYFTEKCATRSAFGKILNAIAPHIPTLIGGSADLAGSVKTTLKGFGDFQSDSPHGRNIHYGVREHAMAAATNGMCLHGGVRGYTGTFLIFSDYCRPSIRLAALQRCPSLFVFSHDSIGLGEDGPTHQPIEHLASLRAIPNLNVARPADGNETSACIRAALELTETPTCLVTTRQDLPICTSQYSADHPAHRGGYILRDCEGEPEITLIGTGSEVHLCLAAAELLSETRVRVVSLPSWWIFEQQTEEYRQEVLGVAPRLSVEAASSFGWARYAQGHVAMDWFGASAPAEVLLEQFGFSAESVAKATRKLLG